MHTKYCTESPQVHLAITEKCTIVSKWTNCTMWIVMNDLEDHRLRNVHDEDQKRFQLNHQGDIMLTKPDVDEALDITPTILEIVFGTEVSADFCE